MNAFEMKYAEIRAMTPFRQAQNMARYRDMYNCPVCPNQQYLCEL